MKKASKIKKIKPILNHFEVKSVKQLFEIETIKMQLSITVKHC
jgi:hypothetical protein